MTTMSRLAGVLAAAAALATAVTLAATPATARPIAPTIRPVPSLSWSLLTTPTSTASLRGLSAVNRRVLWAGGSEGTILRSVDGGRTVTSVGPARTSDLQFRSVYASSALHAVAASIGDTPDAMRVYVTDNGGRTWRMSQQNTLPTAFYDCMTFTNKRTGYILSDPVDGKFLILKTTNGGHSWRQLPSRGMPPALEGEAGFAASGTCIASNRRGDLFFGTGGADPGRIFRSTDGGHSWRVTDSPIAGNATGGVFSLSFGPGRRGVAVGGDFMTPDTAVANAAWTGDRGRTWHAGTGLGGYRSGSAWMYGFHNGVLAVGTSGSDVSWDAGRTYVTFDTGTFNTVDCVPWACFAAGAQGRMARLVVGR
ncbi:MAG: oxidoreductase [Intrasporangium sp.]|uniref:WD40/YVTN/BNR-like repeat-containing protein n=1 Tax=Intrasporangium sp. TaxID=1925024 RepID=UPI002647B4E8|nr:oxidoreductase [Intrasporangium sp.]MDN5796245.1 oxidoreductase [Intrasporangium sp.]